MINRKKFTPADPYNEISTKNFQPKIALFFSLKSPTHFSGEKKGLNRRKKSGFPLWVKPHKEHCVLARMTATSCVLQTCVTTAGCESLPFCIIHAKWRGKGEERGVVGVFLCLRLGEDFLCFFWV